MSGSSKVDFSSEYYHVSSESPCMNFHYDPDHPGQEMEWHRSWMERGAAWLEAVKPILEQRFRMLAADPDPDWPIVRYDEAVPVWHEWLKPAPPFRLGFSGMNGPGMTQVLITFSRLPSEAARERLKQELIKDVAMLDAQEGMI